MTTLLVSDLHLGLGGGGDLVRQERFRDRLMREAEGADQVVLLGDVVELRGRPLAQVVEIAEPFFETLGEAVGDGRIVAVPGNHDYQLAAGLLEKRRLQAQPRPLGLEHLAKPSGPLATLARRAGKAEVVLAYPGLWIRPDVYATHGHYIDRHTTVPTFERMGLAAMGRLMGAAATDTGRPDDYERTQAPLYGLLYDLAQGASPLTRYASPQPSMKVWSALAGSRRGGLRRRLLGSLVVPGAIALANRLSLGPVSSDLSLEEIGRAGVRAMGEVVGRLGIEADHVIFGHTHRRGPLEGEPPWVLPGGARLHNTGSWVYASSLMGPVATGSGFWPGTVAVVGGSGPPELRHLLDDLSRAELRKRSDAD